MTMTSEMLPDSDRRKAGRFEQHVQTVMISIVTGAIVFAAQYVYSDSREKAVLQTQLEVLTAQVIEMRSDLRALQSAYATKTDVKELELRIRQLERSVK